MNSRRIATKAMVAALPFKAFKLLLKEAIGKAALQVAQKAQRRGARRSMSGGVLLYVDAKSIERNEAYELFQQPANPRGGHF
jgi:hypothetical protein